MYSVLVNTVMNVNVIIHKRWYFGYRRNGMRGGEKG
jgi:hypothetical protein